MKKISVVGRGLSPEKHLSLAAISILKSADIVIGIEPEIEAWSELKNTFKLPDIIDINHLYVNGAKDLDNYNSFVEYIFTLLSEHKRIALLVAGHPRLGVTFATLLKKYQEAKGCSFEIEFVEAISSFDVMLNDLELDPLERGTSILDANRLLLFQYNIETSLNYFIYHICSVGTEKTNYRNPQNGNKILALQKYLQQYYAENKQIFLCKASNGRMSEGQYLPVSLSHLSDNIHLIDFGTTLYIPAEQPSKFDFSFYEVLKEEV